jgi:hypothetical protein
MGNEDGAGLSRHSDRLRSKYISKVGAEAQLIVSIRYIIIVPMDYVDIPAHQTHLQAKDGMVGTVVGKDETDCLIVGNPHKALTKKHVAPLVHCRITRESLAGRVAEALKE